MKSTIQLISFLLPAFTSGTVYAQEIKCSAFCVTEIQLDSVDEDLMNVTIFFTGEDTDFINYPYVSSVIDQDGDTIGTGTLNFFGQIGNSSQTYPVTALVDQIPDNLVAIVNFNYDTISCTLNFPCLTNAILDVEKYNELVIYPNPFAIEATISSELAFSDLTINIFNSIGNQVRQLHHLNGQRIYLERNELPKGTYLIQFIQDNKILAISKVVVIH